MAEIRTYAYEAMFLLSQSVAADFAGAIAHLNDVLSRAGAELLAMQKWDERRLAYEVDKQRRGVFILAYFKAPADKIAGLERDCNLSEKIMRTLLLRADHLTEDEMRAFDQRTALETEARLRAERRDQEQAQAAAQASATAAAIATEEGEESGDDNVDAEE